MKTIVPSYYPRFRCLADRCRHNCCIGWEIDIDDTAAARYRAADGEIGQRLRDAITVSEDGTRCFALDTEERCPLLNAAGLCDIISQLGEDALCQICADHPRFRRDFTTHTEMGLGLCCEAAAALIVNETAPLRLIVHEDDGKAFSPTEDELRFFRTRESLFSVALDRRRSLNSRERRLLALVGRRPRPLSRETLFMLYNPLERLDPAWSRTLERLLTVTRDTTVPSLTVPFENLLCTFLYRHVSGALDDGRLPARVAFAVHSVRLLRLLSPTDTAEVAELARQYSAEIEYSNENLEALLNVF